MSADGEPGDRPAREEAMLRDLERAVEQAAQAKQLVDLLAQQARDLGISWTRIARAAGVTQQAAHQRWSTDGNRRHAEQQRKRSTQVAGGQTR